jgi:hypothetical protein
VTEDEIRAVTNIVRDEMRNAFDEQNETISRMMTILEGHGARIERLEYHVLHLQPLPPMRSARNDH